MSEQRGRTESAVKAGGAGQPPSSGSSGSDGQLAGSSSHHPAATFSLHSTDAFTGDAMSDVDSSPTAAVAADSQAAACAAAAQPPTDSSQTQGQPDQLAVDSMTPEEVIEAMAAVHTQRADEFVRWQLRLMHRLSQLLGMTGDSASWLRASHALSGDQALSILHVALRVEGTDVWADELVSDRSSA